MYKVEGDLYPHREYWPRHGREFFHHMMPSDLDGDSFLIPIKPIADWLAQFNIKYTTVWEEKGAKFFVFERRFDAIHFALAWT